MRGGDVDHIEIVGSDKLLVVAIGLLESHARCEFLSTGFATGTDCNDILRGVGTNRLNESLGDPARAENAPADDRRLAGGFDSGFRQ
jgi:hypothetical protein